MIVLAADQVLRQQTLYNNPFARPQGMHPLRQKREWWFDSMRQPALLK